MKGDGRKAQTVGGGACFLTKVRRQDLTPKTQNPIPRVVNYPSHLFIQPEQYASHFFSAGIWKI